MDTKRVELFCFCSRDCILFVVLVALFLVIGAGLMKDQAEVEATGISLPYGAVLIVNFPRRSFDISAMTTHLFISTPIWISYLEGIGPEYFPHLRHYE